MVRHNSGKPNFEVLIIRCFNYLLLKVHMETPEIIDYINQHPSAKVKIAFTDLDGILRGKYLSAGKFLSVINTGMGFCDVLFGWDAGDQVYDNVEYTGWHTGYPDAPARIDLSTFRKIPRENDLPFSWVNWRIRLKHPAAFVPDCYYVRF